MKIPWRRGGVFSGQIRGNIQLFTVMEMILYMWTERYMADEILCESSLEMLQRKKIPVIKYKILIGKSIA